MVLDCLFGNVQLLRDLFIGQARREQLQNLFLPIGELLQRLFFRRSRGGRRVLRARQGLSGPELSSLRATGNLGK